MLYYRHTSFFTSELVSCWHKEVLGTLKKKQTLNLTIFVWFSFLEVRNIRGTYCECFQKHYYETDISSSSQ